MIRISVLCRLALLVCALAYPLGCGSSARGEDEGRVVLRLWVFSSDVENHLRPVLREFEAENPGIRVEPEQLPWEQGFEKILLSLATRRPPDVCELGMTWLAPFAQEGVLLPLDDVLPDIEQRTLVDAATYDGTLYGAPWMVGTRLFFYNRALLREAGYEDARPPATWDELMEMSAAVTALGRGRRGIGLPAGDGEFTWQTFYSFLASGRVPLLNEEREPLIRGEEFLSTLEFYRGLKDYALIDRGPQLDRAFGTGTIAFHISGAWNFTLLPRDYPTLDYGFSYLPVPDFAAERENAGGAMAGGQLLVVFRGSRHPEEATRLLQFLADRDVATRLTVPIRSVLPAFEGAEEFEAFRDDPARVFHAELIERAMAPAPVPYWEDMRRDLVTLLDTALLTDAPLDRLLDRTHTHWSGLAEEYR